MHPAKQRFGKPDKLSQGVHKQTSYPRVQWENTLDKWEATEPRGKQKNLGSRARKKPERGEHKVKGQEQEHRTTHAAGS